MLNWGEFPSGRACIFPWIVEGVCERR